MAVVVWWCGKLAEATKAKQYMGGGSTATTTKPGKSSCLTSVDSVWRSERASVAVGGAK